MTILKKAIFSSTHTCTHIIFIFNFQFGTKAFIVIVVVKFPIVFQCWSRLNMLNEKKVEDNLLLGGKNVAV